MVKNRFRELSTPEPAAKRGFEGFYMEDPSSTKRERTRLKVVVADNPVNFESIHCCGFLHRVKPGFPPMKDVSLEYLIARYNGESCYDDEETDRSTYQASKTCDPWIDKPDFVLCTFC